MLSYRVINVKFRYSKCFAGSGNCQGKKNKNVQKIFLGHVEKKFSKKKFQKTVIKYFIEKRTL